MPAKLLKYCSSIITIIPTKQVISKQSRLRAILRTMASYPESKTDQEWRATLSPEQFRVLREKGTESAYSHPLASSSGGKNGVYECVACSNPLYKAETKFDSHCGWPSFYEAIPGAIELHDDKSFGMVRTEMVCAKCGGHLGEYKRNILNELHAMK